MLFLSVFVLCFCLFGVCCVCVCGRFADVCFVVLFLLCVLFFLCFPVRGFLFRLVLFWFLLRLCFVCVFCACSLFLCSFALCFVFVGSSVCLLFCFLLCFCFAC